MLPDFDSLDELLAASCEGRATPTEMTRLSALLKESPELRDRYLHYMDLHAQLASDATLFGEVQAAPCTVNSEAKPIHRIASASRWRRWSQAIHPRRHPLAFAATVMVLTLGYWLSVQATFLHPGSGTPVANALAIDVAVLSDVHEVQWAASQAPLYGGERLSAGSQLHWTKGLIEITFDSGARVVVEGPAQLQVDSPLFGRLSEGKLVALVPQAGRGFTLDLPSARVIDLGTEFGVVARRSGVADLIVYQGTVQVSPPHGSKNAWKSQQLVAGQSLRLEQSGPSLANGANHIALGLVRALPSSDLSLDIADIVAGGSGRGRATNAGFKLRDGSRAARFSEGIVAADNAYHPVSESSLIDGVFLIRGDAQPQPVASQGQGEFVFPSGTGQSWGQLWAWEPQTSDPSTHTWIHTYPHNPGRLIAMHANSGMTLDLAELRAAYPEHRVRRLLGYVLDEFVPSRGGKGNRTAAWVIVDGQERLRQSPLRSGEKPARVDVALTDEDRFLTLAATDGGDGLACDFVMWKHLRLLLEAVESASSKAENESASHDAETARETTP